MALRCVLVACHANWPEMRMGIELILADITKALKPGESGSFAFVFGKRFCLF